MKFYILLTFFPIYYSLIKQVCLNKLFCFYKNDSLELELGKKNFKFVKEGYMVGDAYDNRENITDDGLSNLNFEKMYLLKKLENKDISIYTKLSLISYLALNEYYITNLHAGGLLDDWDFI